MYPAFEDKATYNLLKDQYAFRPTGSTTSALISIQQQATQMLENNVYVAKAFETVCHDTHAKKLAAISMPDRIYNLVVDFLRGRSHVTCFQGGISKERVISASVVQGSGIGPSSFIVCASDLHPVREENKMAKYADDTYLLVGGSVRHTPHEEIGNVSLWAEENNLRLNPQKTKEILVARHSRRFLPPPLLDRVQRVSSLLVLAVTLEDNLRVTEHVERTLEACSRSLYDLLELRSHVLRPSGRQSKNRCKADLHVC